MSIPRKHIIDLCELFASVRDTKDIENLLRDILTPQELESVAERWQVIQLLDAGLSQREIAKKLNVSVAKATRGSRVLKYGKGSFVKALQKK